MIYLAKQTIGQFKIGDKVKGLTDERIKQLLEIDAVEQVDLPDTDTDTDTDEVKPVSKMTVPELKEYIVEHGGEFDEADKKDALVVIAEAIENELNQGE